MRKLAILLCWFVFAQKSFTQNRQEIIKKRFPVRTINYENGLMNNTVGSIISDDKGFTWIATFTGLQRYNGYRLQIINPVAGTDTFYINYTVSFFKASNGNILISTKEGILEYDAHHDKFTLLIVLKAEPAFQFGVIPLKETMEGLWCMQQNKGIVLYSRQGKLLQQFSFLKADIFNNILQSLFLFYRENIAVNDECIYISDFNKDVFCINTINKTSNVIHTGEQQFAIACLHNNLYLSAKNNITIISDNGFGERRKVLFDSPENITSTSLKKADKEHLFFSSNAHLYVIDTACKIEYELTDRDKNIFVKNGNIQKIYPDKFNRIWALGYDIKRIENAALLFQNFTYPASQTNFIRALYYDEQKHILLAGGYDGIIQAYDTLGNPLWQKPVITKTSEYLLNIEKLADDKYLAIPYNNDAFVFSATSQKIYPFKTVSKKNNLKDAGASYQNNLQRINDSIILIATNSNVLKCVFNKDVLMSATPLIKEPINKNLNCFVYTADKTLYAGTDNGLIYAVKENTVERFQIPGNYLIRSMTENSQHQLCVGSNKGLFIYDNKYKLVNSYDISSGLRNDCIYAIAVSGKDLFVSTNLGLSCIRENGRIQNFSKEMGLQDNEFNNNSVFKTNSGRLFFGGVNGVTAFYPSSFESIKDSPLIQIAQLKVNDVLYNASSGLWHGDTIQLNYQQNHLRLDVAALGFFNADEYIYTYRMKGLDTTWQTASSLTDMNYTLQPANYTLQIKAHPALSPKEISTKYFYIIISPAWWQTWWFKTIAGLCAIGVIYFIVYRYNKTKYLKKIRLLETQQQIQTERERISRELHDNIGAQLSFIISNIDWTIDSAEHISKDEEKQRLTTINSTARNVMGNLRESIWALNKEKITLEEFADKLKAYIQNIITLRPEIEFISKESIASNISFSPTETLNIFRICQEVINNVIKHANASCLKFLIASDAAQKLSIIIEDNGRGFDVSGAMNGYGLENIKYRAEEMKLHLSVQSKAGIGTVVSIYK